MENHSFSNSLPQNPPALEQLDHIHTHIYYYILYIATYYNIAIIITLILKKTEMVGKGVGSLNAKETICGSSTSYSQHWLI